MRNIEEQALQTYNDNILFLQMHHQDVLKKVLILDDAIQKNQYKEKYALEYIDESFNIINLQTKQLFYEKGSKKHAKESLKEVDFSKNKNVFQSYKYIDISDDFEEDLKNLDAKENFLLPTAKLIAYSNKFANADNTTLRKIHKFIFTGVGLGLHILEIHKKIKADIYYILESDLEIFKLSLFVTNYSEITKDNSLIIFSIFDDGTEFKHNTQRFLQESFIYNQHIKFFSFSTEYDEVLQALHQEIISQNYLNFDFVSMTKAVVRPLEYLQEKYKLLNLNALAKTDILQEKPILLLGAGPSLAKNLRWLQKNQDKFIILSISTILSELEKYQIKPDIITHVHGDELALVHIQKVRNISFFKNSLIIFAAMALREFTAYFPKEDTFIFQTNSTYKKDFSTLVTENVGSTSLHLLLQGGARNIYLLGLDFALDQETGKTHIASHKHTKTASLKEREEVDGALDYEMGVTTTQGNFQESVFTTLLYKNQAKELSDIIQKYPQRKTIYNLSEGAFIEKTEALKIDEIEVENFQTIDKKEFFTHYKQHLNNICENFLTPQELQRIREDIEDASLRLKLLEAFMQIKKPNLVIYQSELLKLFQKFLSTQIENAGESLSHILSLYFQFVSGYIFDILNTKEIKNPKKLIKEMNKLFIPQLKKIIQNYQEDLEEAIA